MAPGSLSFEKMKKFSFSKSIILGYLIYGGMQAYEVYKHYPSILSQMDEYIAQTKHHEERVAKAFGEIIRYAEKE